MRTRSLFASTSPTYPPYSHRAKYTQIRVSFVRHPHTRYNIIIQNFSPMDVFQTECKPLIDWCDPAKPFHCKELAGTTFTSLSTDTKV